MALGLVIGSSEWPTSAMAAFLASDYSPAFGTTRSRWVAGPTTAYSQLCGIDLLEIDTGWTGSTQNTSVIFGALGAVGTNCANTTNAYVNVVQSGRALIDVWKALKDGIWSSSVAIKLYGDYGINSNFTISAFPFNKSDSYKVTKSYQSIAYNPAPSCAGNLLATVTVNTDGSLSIA